MKNTEKITTVLQGKPVREAILELYAESEDFREVAKALGVSRQTLYVWRLKYGITETELAEAVVAQRKASDDD